LTLEHCNSLLLSEQLGPDTAQHPLPLLFVYLSNVYIYLAGGGEGPVAQTDCQVT